MSSILHLLSIRRAPIFFSISLLLLCAVSCSISREPSFYLGGIQVNEADHDHWISSLRQAQMNTVAVTVYAHQGDWNSENLWFDKTNESVINEIRTAKKNSLHVVLIMRVALDHAFKENQFLWHGMIQPKSDAELEEWFSRYQRFVLQWARIAEEEGVDVFGIGSEMNSLTSTTVLTELPPLNEYYLDDVRQRAHHQKLLTGSEGVDSPHLLIPGGKSFETLRDYLQAQQKAHAAWAREVSYSGNPNAVELMNVRRRKLERYWRVLIEQVRSTYSGSLTYASNFDQFELVTFWNQLDIMGVNAYFPLREEYLEVRDANTLSDLLESSWDEILASIDAVRVRDDVSKMPLIFTELGYTHKENSTLEPWAMDGFSIVAHGEEVKRIVWREQKQDFGERTLAMRALHKANQKLDKPLLKGILYWKLSTIKSHLEIEPFVHIIGDPQDREFASALTAFL